MASARSLGCEDRGNDVWKGVCTSEGRPMEFVFYPKHEHRCPHVGHCPHLGGASLGSLVVAASEQDEYVQMLHGQLHAERQSVATLVAENARLLPARDRSGSPSSGTSLQRALTCHLSRDARRLPVGGLLAGSPVDTIAGRSYPACLVRSSRHTQRLSATLPIQIEVEAPKPLIVRGCAPSLSRRARGRYCRPISRIPVPEKRSAPESSGNK